MVEEETLDGGPKDGGKEELGEREWVSLNTLVSGRLRYNETIQLY